MSRCWMKLWRQKASGRAGGPDWTVCRSRGVKVQYGSQCQLRLYICILRMLLDWLLACPYFPKLVDGTKNSSKRCADIRSEDRNSRDESATWRPLSPHLNTSGSMNAYTSSLIKLLFLLLEVQIVSQSSATGCDKNLRHFRLFRVKMLSPAAENAKDFSN